MSEPTIATHDVQRFLDLIDRGATRQAIEFALGRLETGSVATVVTDLLAPAQREVGERWHRGRYTVSQEHLASGVVDDVLGMLALPALRTGSSDNTLALVCAEGEWHSTPARMASILIRDAGWQVRFLGASTPLQHLQTSLRQMAPQAVGISCTLPLTLTAVPELTGLAHDLGLPVIVGGQAFGPEARRGARLGADGAFVDIPAAVRRLEFWLDRPPSMASVEPDADRDLQRSELAARRMEIVDDAYAMLERRLPGMAAFDERRRRHTREDLDYIVRFADVALFVDDPTIFTDFIAWLAQLLAGRGLPDEVMLVTLEAVRDAVGPELPGVLALLDAASGQLAAPDGVPRPRGRSGH